MSEMDQIMAMLRGQQPSQIGPQASQMGQPNYGQPQAIGAMGGGGLGMRDPRDAGNNLPSSPMGGFSGSAMSQRAPMMGGRPMPGNVGMNAGRDALGGMGSPTMGAGNPSGPANLGAGSMGGIMQLIMQMMGRQGQGGMGQPQPMPQAPQAGIGQGSSLAQLAGRGF